mmetsp:Transcript_20579/g.34443  ORF Transcript_20579/g.34443 Transcript_20579/m.34443 type:complete len:1740 (+) Transcript_20579:403-5622(+)
MTTAAAVAPVLNHHTAMIVIVNAMIVIVTTMIVIVTTTMTTITTTAAATTASVAAAAAATAPMSKKAAAKLAKETAAAAAAASQQASLSAAAADAVVALPVKAAKKVNPTTPDVGNAYIFWDYGTCPIEDNPDDLDAGVIGTVAARVRGVINRFLQHKKDTGDPIKIDQTIRSLFAPQGSTFKNISKVPITWGSFTKNDFKVHHYSKKCSMETLMRQVIESILDDKKDKKDQSRLVLCFITNDPNFSTVAAYLKLENLHDTMLLYDFAASPLDYSTARLVKKHFLWQDVVRDLLNRGTGPQAAALTAAADKGPKESKKAKQTAAAAAASSLQQDDKMSVATEDMMSPGERELERWQSHGSDASMFALEDDPQLHPQQGGNNAKGKAAKAAKLLSSAGENAAGVNGDPASMTEDGPDDEGSDPGKVTTVGSGIGLHTFRYNLKYSAIAIFLKRLLVWRKELDEEQGVVCRNYFLGEDTSGYDEEDVGCIVTVKIDMNAQQRHYAILLRGASDSMVNKRAERMKQMIAGVRKVRQCHNVSGWSAEHRLSLMGSDVLAMQEKATRAIVLFHYSGEQSIAEIVALRATQHNALLKFIQKLKPTDMMVEVPAACVSWYDKEMWEKIRVGFAMKAVVISAPGGAGHGKAGGSTASAGKKQLGGNARFISPEDADKMVRLKLIGFLPNLIEKGLDFIKMNDDRMEITVPTINDSQLAVVTAAAAAETLPLESHRSNEASATATAAELEEHTAKSGGKNVVDARAHKSSYNFSDREAGLYFYHFEQVFRTYFALHFQAYVDEEEHRANVKHASNPNFYTQGLKVTFYGATLESVQGARDYMDNFTPNHLGRVQIFYPRVSMKKYKAILTRKLTQLNRLKIEQRAKAAGGKGGDTRGRPTDPMATIGFLNIRIRPIVFGARLKSDAFPADASVTICGPITTPELKAVMEETETIFRAISSEYETVDLWIPEGHFMKQQIAIKGSRETLIKQYSLVAMQWEEGAKRKTQQQQQPPQGAGAGTAAATVGIAKAWAYSKNALRDFTNEVLRTDRPGPNASVAPSTDATLSSSTASRGDGVDEEGEEDNDDDVEDLRGHNELPDDEDTVGFAASTAAGAPPGLHHRSATSSLNGPTSSTASSSTASSPSTTSLPYNNKAAMRGGDLLIQPPPLIQQQQQQQQAKKLKNAPRMTVHVPDLSLRSMLQGDPLKSKLEEIIKKFDELGVHTVYPYKERSDPHACFQLIGDSRVISRAAQALNEFIAKAHSSIRLVQIVMSVEQYHQLTNGGEGVASSTNQPIQELQASCGVHLTFNPPGASTRGAVSLFDMRYDSDIVRKHSASSSMSASAGGSGGMDSGVPSASSFLSQSPAAAALENRNDSKIDTEMISVNVFNCHSYRSVEIAVISSNSSESGWTWGVSNLLLLVGNNTFGFSPHEQEQLNRGDVLVHSDRATGKTILRIKPSAQARGINFQAAVLTNAVLKSLQKANELGLKGLAISAPMDIDTFPDLSSELVRSLTVEAVVEFAKKCRAYLRFSRLVCIEMGNNVAMTRARLAEEEQKAVQESGNPHAGTVLALERKLEPVFNDRMIRTIILLLERQEAEQAGGAGGGAVGPIGGPIGGPMGRGGGGLHRMGMTPGGGGGVGASPNSNNGIPTVSRITLLTCNVPLPLSYYTMISAPHNQHPQQHPQQQHPQQRRGGGGGGGSAGGPPVFKTVLVHGLLSSVVKAVDAIKDKLRAPPPALPELTFDFGFF